MSATRVPQERQAHSAVCSEKGQERMERSPCFSATSFHGFLRMRCTYRGEFQERRAAREEGFVTGLQ